MKKNKISRNEVSGEFYTPPAITKLLSEIMEFSSTLEKQALKIGDEKTSNKWSRNKWKKYKKKTT